MSLEKKEDRIRHYLVPHLDQFIFDELSENYMKKAGVEDILTGVPIPIRKTELTNISTLNIARHMAFVIGCDPDFDYASNYIAYIQRIFTKKFAEGLVSDGVDGAAKNDFDYACIQFRAAIQIDPENVDAVYCYARACKDSYEQGEEEEFVGRYKAESLDAFERVTLMKPEFAEGHYFLGYAYANLGLYVKAQLEWQEFMKLSENAEMKKEIEGRLASLVDPVEIEKGYNMIFAGKIVEGIEVLNKYKDGQYKTWWPMWYYLGWGYRQLGMIDEAIEHMLEVLKLSPSNTDVMKELVEKYREIGDEEKVAKYESKINVVMGNIEKDREEKAKAKAEAAAMSGPIGKMN